MRARRWLVVVGAAGCCLTLAGWRLATGGFSSQAGSGVGSSAVETDGVGEPEKAARVVVDKPRFDFGTMDVGQKGQHTFVLRNEGDAALEVRLGSTSCKCTMVGIEDNRIEPGGEGKLVVAWEASEPHEHFRQGATIRTNDPECPVVQLVVEGQVRSHLACSPSLVYFSSVGRDETRTEQVYLYSQAWEALSIKRVESSLAELSCSYRAMTDRELATLAARSGCLLELTLEPGLPKGAFHGELTIDYETPPGSSTARKGPEVIGVLGEVVGYFTIHGRRVQGTMLRMGAVPRSVGARETASLVVRGGHRDVRFEVAGVEPEFLEVEVARDERVTGNTARYLLEVRVPPGAPEVSYMAPRTGKIRLATDHPESRLLEIDVELAVVP